MKKTTFALIRVFSLMAVILLATSFESPVNYKISLRMETKSLHNGTYSKVISDIYYKVDEGVMVMHYQYPLEFVFVSNQKGEAKMYNPKDNTVNLKQNSIYSSENNYLFYFLSQNANDLGFKEQGYQLLDTKFDGPMMINKWKPPVAMSQLIGEVEMVHKNHIPIYLGFYDPQQKLRKKVFYSGYQKYNDISFPMKITQYDYVSEEDSIITRTEFSNVKLGGTAVSDYFEFKIPEDAKVVE